MPVGSAKRAPENPEGAPDKPESLSMDDLKAKAADLADSVKQQAADIKERAAYSATHPRETAADLMDSAASTISERSEDLPRGSAVRSAALETADVLETGAEYVRTHNATSMLGDAWDTITDHPGISLMSAAVAGFLIGYAVFRDSDSR